MTDSRPGFATASALTLTLMAVLACSPGPGDRPTTAGPGLTGIRYLSDDSDAPGFARADSPRPFVFPADHAPHPAYRTEWWYFTGNLFDARAAHYGFELTFFRVGLEPEPVARDSALATNSVWMAHLTVTDQANNRFHTAERLSRGGSGLAGASAPDAAADSEVRLFVEDFSIVFSGDGASLTAHDDAFGIDLVLTGLDRIVAQGNAGLDAKGAEPGNASYYFSAPRLAVRGELVPDSGQTAVAVEGTAWMDREWSTSALSPDIEGWDWFALQLDNGSDLMFYRLRGRDGSTSPHSGGSITDLASRTERLDAESVMLEPLREWTSPRTRVSYPVAWRMRIPLRDIELEVRPVIDNQELDLSVRYWEGAVTATGTVDGETIAGVGYLELAGY
jgi:predicted secreted hydrolase